MRAWILAVDLGTGGPKVALVAEDGEIAGHELEAVALIHTPDGGVEQDPESWWAATGAAARRLLARELVPPAEIVAVAVTAQWATTVPVDAAGRPVGNALSWMDSRGAPHVRALAGGPVAGYDARKLATWLWLTGGAPSLMGRDPVGHILFLRAERPDVHAAARAFLEPSDYLGARLTGRIATAPETATVHWCTDTRDPRAIAYDPRLLDLIAFECSRLPDLVPSASVLGPVTPTATADLGLERPVPVVVGTPDTMSAAVGSGAVADYATHLYVGTSAWLGCHVPFRRVDPLHAIATLPSSVPGRRLVSNEQQTAGAVLAHLREGLLGAPELPYEELLAEAAAVPAGAGGVLCAPWLNGERTPLDDPDVRAAYTNLSLATTRGHLARATLEGVALNARWMQLYTERFCLRRLAPIALIGGGARSPLWAQIFADVLRRPVRRMAEPTHANVRGAAFLALAGLGRMTLADVPRRAPVAATHVPDPAVRELHDARFAELRRFYRATRRVRRPTQETAT